MKTAFYEKMKPSSTGGRSHRRQTISVSSTSKRTTDHYTALIRVAERGTVATTKQGLSFSRNTTYYRQVTHEFNLPTGHSCPGALTCLTLVDRESGKRIESGSDYVCYAASAERFPSARESRWNNWEAVQEILETNEIIELPPKATHIRIHGSGDFYSPRYFDLWVETAHAHPEINFWAFTKSPHFWIRHLQKFGDLPPNLVLNASRGGKHDYLIDNYSLKCAEVFHHIDDVPEDMLIDLDDYLAQIPGPSFALLENLKNRDQENDARIKAHNERILSAT